MVEGKAPICYLIDQYSKVNIESVMTLMYRCEKLYHAKSEVTKIFALLFKLFHSPNLDKRQPEEYEVLLRRLKGTVSQFTASNRIYDETFMYKGVDIMKMIDSEL